MMQEIRDPFRVGEVIPANWGGAWDGTGNEPTPIIDTVNRWDRKIQPLHAAAFVVACGVVGAAVSLGLCALYAEVIARKAVVPVPEVVVYGVVVGKWEPEPPERPEVTVHNGPVASGQRAVALLVLGDAPQRLLVVRREQVVTCADSGHLPLALTHRFSLSSGVRLTTRRD